MVVGNVNNQGPFYWTQANGVVLLRNSSGNTLGDLYEATSISGDGSVIVGGNPTPGFAFAFRWTKGVAALIPQLKGVVSSASSVSTDGTIIAGDISQTGSNPSGFTLSGTNLEIVPPSSLDLTTSGTIMSANGAVVAGDLQSAFGRSSAYQWTNGALIQWPGSTALISSATAVSQDGSVVVGSTGVDGGDTNPFEWTNVGATYPNGVVTNLPLPTPYLTGSATGVSTDGTTIVGWMSKTGLSNTAFIRTQANGVQDLQTVLTDDGLGSELAGWTLTEATAITPDGSTIVGKGIDPQGQDEGWIVNLNTPTPTPTSPTPTPTSPTPTPTSPTPTPTPTRTPTPRPTPTPTSPTRITRTETILITKPRSANVGQTITLTATVKSRGHGDGLPTGYVTFSAKGILDHMPVFGGKATLTTTSLAVGHDRILGVYSGDQDHLNSDSVVTVTIRRHRSRIQAADSFAFPQSKHSITPRAMVRGGVVVVASSDGTAAILDNSLALGTVLPDQTKTTLTSGSSVVSRRIRPLFARNGDAYSSSSAPRKQTIRQSTAAASKPPAHLTIGD
jgi:uncharacterized membrane protein